jgi:hypothetical protein
VQVELNESVVKLRCLSFESTGILIHRLGKVPRAGSKVYTKTNRISHVRQHKGQNILRRVARCRQFRNKNHKIA